jgi:ParB family transcriptional regulator, chromosome partitioning protein
MQASPAAIRLDEIDWEDTRFAISSFLPDRNLQASLEAVGLLFPPWVWAQEDRAHLVVDGFKRLQWAQEKAFETIPCLVFPSSYRYEQLLLLRVEGKLFGPPLNGAEKAQLVCKMARALSPEHIMDRLLPALGIPARVEVVDHWCRLAAAGQKLLRAVASEEVSERAALTLVLWGEAERALMVALLRELRCSASIQMEIIERITEIALSRDRERLAVLEDSQIQSILRNQQLNHRQKTQMLRELLTRLRFPRLREREERFARELKALSLPNGVRILHPPAFEGEDWRLEITFSSSEELNNLLEKMQRCAPSQVLLALMEPGAGGHAPGSPPTVRRLPEETPNPSDS